MTEFLLFIVVVFDIADNKSLKQYIMEQMFPIGNWRQYVINGNDGTTISFA